MLQFQYSCRTAVGSRTTLDDDLNNSKEDLHMRNCVVRNNSFVKEVPTIYKSVYCLYISNSKYMADKMFLSKLGSELRILLEKKSKINSMKWTTRGCATLNFPGYFRV